MQTWRRFFLVSATLAVGALLFSAPAWSQQDEPRDTGVSRGRNPGRPAPAQPPPQAPAQEAGAPTRSDDGPRPSRPAPPAELVTKVVPLKHTAAREIAGVLNPLTRGVGGFTQVVADDRTNALIVQADNAQTLARVGTLIEQLDLPPQSENAETKIFFQAVPLKNARAVKVEGYLRNLAQMRGLRISVDADEASNTMWIGGDPAQGPMLAKIAQSIDASAATPAASVAELRTFALQHAQPHKLAGTLAQVMRIMGLDTAVVPDDAAGMLIAYAKPEESKRLEQLIRLLDVPSKYAPQPEKAEKTEKEKTEKN